MNILKTNDTKLEESNAFNELIDRHERSIFLNLASSIKKVMLKDINFIEGFGDYMKFHCEQDVHVVHITMARLELQLPAKEFLRVHRSYMVRLDKIEVIYSRQLQIKGRDVPVSSTYKKNLMIHLPVLS